MQAYSKPILGLSAIQSATFVELFQDYRKELAQAGYNPCVARLHLRSVAHFGVWLELEGVALESIDEQTVATFDRHRSSCRCPGTSRDCGRHVVSCPQGSRIESSSDCGLTPIRVTSSRTDRSDEGIFRRLARKRS